MKIIKLLPTAISYFFSSDGEERAATSFEKLAQGSPPTPRTPLFKGQTEDEVISTWTEFLTSYSRSNPVYQPLIDYDLSRTSKVGPQGGLRPLVEREDDLFAYWSTPDQSIPNTVIDDDLISDCAKIAYGNNRNKRPLSPNNVIDLDKYDNKLITNSGCTEFNKRNIPKVIDVALSDVRSGKWEELPMCLFSRSQRGSERFVFGAPFALNIWEKTFLYPLMDAIRGKGDHFFSAWEGFDAVELGFQDQNFFNKDHVYIQQDFTKMDKHVNQLQMDIVFEMTKDFFQSQWRQPWNQLLSHILHIGVLMNLDKMVIGLHGMPSGSGLTNFAESLINLYIMSSYNANGLEVVAKQGLGDDGVFAIKRNGLTDQEILDVMVEYSTKVGQQLNPEKQGISDHTTIYLQRFFDDRIPTTDGKVLGMYPSILALNTAMNPERYHKPSQWSGNLETLRWIMILENCKNLPYFHDLIQYFMKGDKFALGLNIPDFFITLPKLYEESQAIKGFIPTYNQESLDRGINDFETVKYLKGLYQSG